MAKGQVLVEALIGLSLLLVVLLAWQQTVEPSATANQQALTAARDAIWARQLDTERTRVSDDYFGAKATGKLLSEAGKLIKLDFETNNLRHTKDREEDAKHADYRMARLTDTWSPESAERLAGRPRSLVFNTLLANGLVRTLQDGLGYLPFAKEIRSKSLIFGHIDTDVVPEDKLVKVPYR